MMKIPDDYIIKRTAGWCKAEDIRIELAPEQVG